MRAGYLPAFILNNFAIPIAKLQSLPYLWCIPKRKTLTTMATTRTATQVLQGFYTVAMCADADDARNEYNRLVAKSSADELKLPAVARRIAGYMNLLIKLEGPAKPEVVAPALTVGDTVTLQATGEVVAIESVDEYGNAYFSLYGEGRAYTGDNCRIIAGLDAWVKPGEYCGVVYNISRNRTLGVAIFAPSTEQPAAVEVAQEEAAATQVEQPAAPIVAGKYILRLEHAATGVGPFREPGNINGYSAEAHQLANDRRGEQWPCATLDIPAFLMSLLFGVPGFVIGVEYMSQLYHWLGDDLAPYLQRGYQVVLYTVPSDAVFNSISGLQVAFNPRYATSREVIY